MKSKILAIVSAVAFSFSSFTSLSAADVPEENFYPSVKQEAGWMGYNTDNSIGHTESSSLYALAI